MGENGLFSLGRLMAMKAPQGEGTPATTVPSLLWKNSAQSSSVGRTPRKPSHSVTKADSVGREVMRLEVVEFEEGSKESARREAEAAQAVRAEDHPLALLWCRRNLPRWRLTNPH